MLFYFHLISSCFHFRILLYKCKKFDRREDGRTSCRVISIRGYRRGAVAYLIFKVSYDLQSLSKFSAPRFLFTQINLI